MSKKKLGFFAKVRQILARMIATFMANGLATIGAGTLIGIDILDAVIANFGINYVVVLDLDANRFTTINKANAALASYLNKNTYDIGEEIMITDFYKVLQKVPGVIDVIDLEIIGKSGTSYSDLDYDFDSALTANGRRIQAESNVVFELKFPNVDIKGSVQ